MGSLVRYAGESWRATTSSRLAAVAGRTAREEQSKSRATLDRNDVAMIADRRVAVSHLGTRLSQVNQALFEDPRLGWFLEARVFQP